MKILTLLCGAALAASLSTTAAHAADFTGPRVELRGGWDRLDVKEPDFKLDKSDDGILYGVGVGYDVGLGRNLIAGVEANFDLSNTEFEEVAGNTRVEAKAKRDIEVSARLGAKLGERVLVYGKAGYTNARIKGVITIGGTTGTTREEFAANGDGFRVGAGAEFAITENAYAKTEYRYSNYEGGISRHQAVAALGFRF